MRITETAAADRLGLTLGELRARRYAGKIGHIVDGRKIFYTEKHLEAYEASCEVSPSSCDTTIPPSGISGGLSAEELKGALRGVALARKTMQPKLRSRTSSSNVIGLSRDPQMSY